MNIELRRKAYSKLLRWKEESAGSTALLVNGARRVGKSHLVRKFAENEYRSHIIIDFAKIDETTLEVFKNHSSDLDDFFQKLMVAKGRKLYPRESVVVFDEVQLYPPARQMIKYLVEDGRYDYIETGSLISIRTNVQDIVVPSEEDDLEMFPLDFEEFLWAMGNETAIPYMEECFRDLKPLGNAAHKKIMDLFRKYMLVGGMPQAVINYVTTGSFEKTEAVKKRILSVYRKDIAKYAGGYSQRVNFIFDTIPSQLAKGEKKYLLSSLDKNARYRDFDDAFMWLADGMIVNPCVNATDPTVGLMMSADHTSQKLYMGDTGLLVTESLADRNGTDEDIYKSLLLGKIGIIEGMFAENVVAQCLRANGNQLYFYSRYPRPKDGKEGREEPHNGAEADSGNDAGVSDQAPVVWDTAVEIDFLIRRGHKICPLEVKSSDRIRYESLERFIGKFKGRLGQPYILCTKDIRVKDGIVLLPLYMAALL